MSPIPSGPSRLRGGLRRARRWGSAARAIRSSSETAWAATGAPTLLAAAGLLIETGEGLTSSALRRQLGGSVRPSFHREVMQVRSLISAARHVPGAASTPLRRLPRKLDNYRFGASHGVGVPHVHGVWTRLDDVPWAELPSAFVFKADRGANGRGVMPLRREGASYRTLDGGRAYTPEQLRDHWHELRTAGRCSGPFFVEELLPAPAGSTVPEDVKVFAFYGEVSHVMLRRVIPGAAPGVFHRRYLSPEGDQLADEHVLAEQDPTIAVPGRLEEMVAAAKVLSRNAPFPFLRVDMYDLGDRSVLGELTLAPGGRVAYAPGFDEHLGTLWLQAQTRLMVDLAAGRPYAMVPGPHPVSTPR